MSNTRIGAEAVLWRFMDGWWGPTLEAFQVLSAGEWAVSIDCYHCGDTHEGSGATLSEAIQQLIDDQAVTHCPECGRELLHPVPDCGWERDECAQCYRAAIGAELRETKGRSI